MFAEENATLIKRKEALKDANEEAGRQLENAKETITKLRSPGFHPSSLASSGFAGLTGGSHKHSPSVASTQSNSAGGINERSPLGISSRPNGSPDLDSKLEWTSRTTELNNNEYQAPAVVKKFKWGKSTKHEVARPNHHAKDNLSNVLLVAGSSASTSMSNTGANGSGSKSSSPMGRTNGSSDLTSRAHMFQQTSILRPVRCEYCGDKMWGLNEVRCTGKFLRFFGSLSLSFSGSLTLLGSEFSLWMLFSCEVRRIPTVFLWAADFPPGTRRYS